ncbi:MAG TPA: hypothetical protein VM186_03590 [Planctomycetota bacterium]|nr:hypothetical protein [Planctomycetota bacterium]
MRKLVVIVLAGLILFAGCKGAPEKKPETSQPKKTSFLHSPPPKETKARWVVNVGDTSPGAAIPAQPKPADVAAGKPAVPPVGAPAESAEPAQAEPEQEPAEPAEAREEDRVIVKAGDEAAPDDVGADGVRPGGTRRVPLQEDAPAEAAEAAAEAAADDQPPPHPGVEELGAAGQIAVFDFKDTPMPDVLKVFTTLTGMNVVASSTVANLKITLFLKDVSPRAALSTMCKLYNLWFTEDENVIRVITAEEYGKELIIRRDEKTVVLTLKYASVLGVADTIAKLMGDSVVYEQPEEFASYGHVGTEAGRAAGGGAGSGTGTSYRSNTTYSDYGYGAGRSAPQTGFEKGLTSTKIEALERAGVKPGGEGAPQAEILKDIKQERPLAHIAVFPRNNCLAVRSVDAQLLEQITKLVKELDTVTTQVLLETKILEISLTGGFSSMFDLTIRNDHPQGAPGTDKHDAGVGNFQPLSSPTMAYTFIDQSVRARMHLMEEAGRVREIASPLILCANNAPGLFFVGEERPITVNWEYEVRDYGSATGTTSRETTRPVVVIRDIGMRVSVSPSINDDGTVTMRLSTDISTVNQGGATIDVVDANNQVRKLSIDTVNTSNVDSIIIAKDSNTLALGGLIQERDSRVERKVPILGSIPVIGFFFKRMELEKSKTEIVILITPHIMMSPTVAETVSSETLGELSDHPYIKQGRKHVVTYDEDTDKLKATSGSKTQRGK